MRKKRVLLAMLGAVLLVCIVLLLNCVQQLLVARGYDERTILLGLVFLSAAIVAIGFLISGMGPDAM